MDNHQHLKGLIAAPFTPMHRNGDVNLDLIPEYYQLLKKNGVTGAFICGSTGEGPSLTVEEKKLISQAWGEVTRHDPNFTVITFLGGTSVRECQQLASHAQQSGVHAVAFTAPYYFKPADVNALVNTCAEVAAAVPQLPFYYYHIPVLTGVSQPMLPFLQALDGRIPNFVGIKYTHEDFMDFMACLHFEQKRYDLLWGRDENYLSALAIGTQGAVGSTYNYAAPLYTALDKAFESGDLVEAQRLQLTAINMIRLLGKYGGIATGKAYMKLIGLDCGLFRWPIKNMDDTKFEAFRKDVEGLDFHTFCSTVGSHLVS